METKDLTGKNSTDDCGEVAGDLTQAREVAEIIRQEYFDATSDNLVDEITNAILNARAEEAERCAGAAEDYRFAGFHNQQQAISATHRTRAAELRKAAGEI